MKRSGKSLPEYSLHSIAVEKSCMIVSLQSEKTRDVRLSQPQATALRLIRATRVKTLRGATGRVRVRRLTALKEPEVPLVWLSDQKVETPCRRTAPLRRLG